MASFRLPGLRRLIGQAREYNLNVSIGQTACVFLFIRTRLIILVLTVRSPSEIACRCGFLCERRENGKGKLFNPLCLAGLLL